MSFWFGDFELDQERRQLLRAGDPVPLEPKAYELLSLLLERRPRALSRAQIRDAIWPSTFVSESTLAVVVNGIRAALADDARQPRFVRTVHGFGYAFCGEARASGDGRTAGVVAPPTTPEPVASSPYPGLSAFTEADAERFFGREAEVESLWSRIQRRPLLAVIGPSGVGKTSFVRAGVIPRRPSGWIAAYLTPGTSPISALARALVPDLAGDADTIDELFRGVDELRQAEEPGRLVAAARNWGARSAGALLVVDQLEELFTQNTPEAQSRFVALLGRLSTEAGLHVMLSLRDDFLFRCSRHEELRPLFRDLTPLTPPSAAALRRALTEPAARRGVRFEDETLVEEMVEAVASERGALPLLAFTVSELWEKRDRERRLLQREAYEAMGGVAGALAHHAEATLARLGGERDGIVREVFRNVVTAEGTRAVADRDELLSVFGSRKEAAEPVLDALVEARLLTEYEADVLDTGHDAGRRRVELVHESLLVHWTRLAGWRTQDAHGARLRDQLRQAAHLWEERGRPEDLLWRGASYLDYRAWRARYVGGLSALEGEFGRAMTALAERRKRRRWMVATATVAVLAVALGVVAVLWARTEAARRQATAEALRAEASKLLALSQAALREDRTAALAYVTASLELAETDEARLFAVRVLQDGPPAFSIPSVGDDTFHVAAFSPDGEWLVDGGRRTVRLHRRSGVGPMLVTGAPPRSHVGIGYGFSPRSDRLFGDRGGSVTEWSLPDLREARRLRVEQGADLFVGKRRLVAMTTAAARTVVRAASLQQGDFRVIGEMEAIDVDATAVDADGARMAFVDGPAGEELYVRSLEDWGRPPKLIGTHPARVLTVAFDPGGHVVAAGDKSGRIRTWDADGRSKSPQREMASRGVFDIRYSPGGRWLAAAGVAEAFDVRLWDLTGPPSIRPLRVPIFSIWRRGWAIDSSDRWLATRDAVGVALQPVGAPYPRIVGQQDWFVDDVAFTPDGTTLLSVSAGADGTLRAWPLSPDAPDRGSVILRAAMNHPRLAVDPNGGRVAVAAIWTASILVAPTAGGPPRSLAGFSRGVDVRALAFSPDGRYLVAAPLRSPAAEKVIRVWSLESDSVLASARLPGAGDGLAGGVGGLAFVDDARVVASRPTDLISFDLRDGTSKVLLPRPARDVAVDGRGKTVFAVLGEPEELVRVAADGRVITVFPCPGCFSVAVDPTGRAVATGSREGIVRIGPAAGGEPHLFFARPSAAGQRVAFSPDGRWVASSGEAPSVRLWPVPDVSRTPLHRRPHEELLGNLHSWTNWRAVRDPQSATGWKLEPGPFPGWEKLPER